MSSSLLSALNGFVTKFHRWSYELGLSERKELPVSTFSVGNISFGGTGKTPFTAWLCRTLKDMNHSPAVLTRGYGREDEDALVVVHDGRRLRANTATAGDEPVLLADKLGDVPVVACADRYKAGRMILKKREIDVAVLDDGMQHYRLARQGEIVLLDSTREYFGPRAGETLLREPLSALSRAHLIVLTRCEDSPKLQRLHKEITRLNPGIPVVRTRFVPEELKPVQVGGEWADSRKPRKVVLAAGIGNPDSFARLMEKSGFTVVGKNWLKDHAAITPSDVRRWMQERKRRGAEAVVVTEKDAVKLREFKKLPQNLWYCPIRLEFLSSREEEIARRVIKARMQIKPIAGYLK